MRSLTYTRWWVLQEMARGRMLAMTSYARWSEKKPQPFLFGLGEPLEYVPYKTAKAMAAKGEVAYCRLRFPADLMHLHYPYQITEKGRERIENRPAWSVMFIDWLVGKYGPAWATKWDGVAGVSLCRSPLQRVTPALPGPVIPPTQRPLDPPPGLEPGQPGHPLRQY